VVERECLAHVGSRDAREAPAPVLAHEAPNLAGAAGGDGQGPPGVDRDGARIEHWQAFLQTVRLPVPEHQRIAARRAGDRVPSRGGDAHAADIALEGDPVARGGLGKRERVLAPMASEQSAAGTVARLPLVLDRDEYRAVGGHVEMADALAMVGRLIAAEQAARGDL